GLYFAFNQYVLPLYLEMFTSNKILIGWLSSTRSFEQSIIQPLVGARSDRTWTRFGRRAPYFLAMMPLTAALLVLNGLLPTPSKPDEPPVFWLVVIIIFAFSLIFNVGIDPYYALLVDVTSAEERGAKSGFAQLCGFLGQFVILIAALYLWSRNPFAVWLLVAVGLVVGFGIVAAGVREPRVLGHIERLAPVTIAGSGRLLVRLLEYARGLYATQREAAKLLGIRFIYQFGINAAAPFLTLFLEHEIGLNGWPEMLAAFPFLTAIGLDQVDPAGLALMISAIFLVLQLAWALPVGALGDRFGKKQVFQFGLLVMGVTALAAAGATTVPQILICLLFLGFGNAAQTVLFGVYLADLIPLERVGEFTGLSAFAETGGYFLSIVVAGALLNWNLFGLQYRLVFILTGIFLLAAVIGLRFVKARLTFDAPAIAPVSAG
ncbi:MAG: MFS transporter, partial [Chloroflexi bacterium]|nr:MFS transporter [Chloroflexota bacterium]